MYQGLAADCGGVPQSSLMDHACYPVATQISLTASTVGNRKDTGGIVSQAVKEEVQQLRLGLLEYVRIQEERGIEGREPMSVWLLTDCLNYCI